MPVGAVTSVQSVQLLRSDGIVCEFTCLPLAACRGVRLGWRIAATRSAWVVNLVMTTGVDFLGRGDSRRRRAAQDLLQEGGIRPLLQGLLPTPFAQVQPRPSDISELHRLVKDLRRHESPLKTELLEHKLVRET
ncbi:hypothetical protein NL676_028937 [Syzygium grande]|nr:hypothetical protein NL676_028937 [Syzygium grande]